MRIKKVLLESENIERDSYIWNMTGSMLVAFQSVVMLMILTRTLGLREAGIFTIAFANANLFLSLGKYGMRNFQVSDVNEQFSFMEYKCSRVLTVFLMIIVSIAYTLLMQGKNTYSLEKTMVIIWMCLMKVVDAVEDVYHGFYQQKNRLDMAGKELTVRMFLTILVFAAGLIISHNLLSSVIITTLVSFALYFIFNRWMKAVFLQQMGKIHRRNILILLKLCFPLFAGAFLSFYIGNAPKYAIDAMLTDELQACYGFIAMPVFVIGLLNSFIFNPMIYRLSILWNEREMKSFIQAIVRQIGIIIVITLTCILGAWLLGIPVLSWLYNTDLSPYKVELLILLSGGGFLGLSGFLNTMNTIIRQQNLLMWGYGIVAIAACLFSDKVVKEYEMFGAAMLYMVLMAVLCVVFLLFLIYGIELKRERTD